MSFSKGRNLSSVVLNLVGSCRTDFNILKNILRKISFSFFQLLFGPCNFNFRVPECHFKFHFKSGPSCSKLTMSLVNVSLKFQMLISEICQYFFLKKRETKNINVFGYEVIKHLTS